MTPRWHRLVLEAGGYNPRVRELAHEHSGAYAIRERDTHRVMYVGESSCGKLWRTLLRHFQAPDSFARVRETGVFRRGADHYEVAIWPTSKGVRTRQGAGKNDPGDPKALEAQAAWIETLKPELNKDDGLAFDDGPWTAPEDDDPWGGLLREREDNPPRTVVELGRLTELAGRDARGRAVVLRWPLKRAPSLAVDERGRLHVVYLGDVIAPASGAERARYRRTHWGQAGRGQVRDGGEAPPPFRRAFVVESITYTTRKGADGALVDYVHRFGEGARGRWRPPVVLEHVCQKCGPRCASRGALTLSGGTYRVETRGIVG